MSIAQGEEREEQEQGERGPKKRGRLESRSCVVRVGAPQGRVQFCKGEGPRGVPLSPQRTVTAPHSTQHSVKKHRELCRGLGLEPVKRDKAHSSGASARGRVLRTATDLTRAHAPPTNANGVHTCTRTRGVGV